MQSFDPDEQSKKSWLYCIWFEVMFVVCTIMYFYSPATLNVSWIASSHLSSLENIVDENLSRQEITMLSCPTYGKIYIFIYSVQKNNSHTHFEIKLSYIDMCYWCQIFYYNSWTR